MYKRTTLLKSVIFMMCSSLLVFTSCNGGKQAEPKQAQEEIQVEVDQDILNDVNQAKKIFYSLPSPLETALLLKSAGATYNEKLLNSLSSASNYTTNKAMALNLGIYTTDLSFASLFDQTQTTINYMQASKKMADGLGILDAIDQNTIKRLEENINNRDIIMEIISETFMSSSSFLKENDRQSIAAIVLVGGWVEGLYIATQMVDPNNIKNNKLVERIVEQKLSIEIVEKLLEENKDNADVKSLMAIVADLKATYSKLEIKPGKIEAVTDTKTNVTTLKSKAEMKVEPKDFAALAAKVKSIRNNFTL